MAEVTVNAKMLEAVEALLEGRLVDDVASYQYKDRSLARLSFGELMALRRRLVHVVNEENRRRLGFKGPRRYRVRFG